MTKCYYVIDTFNKTRLPGYHLRLESAQNRKLKFDTMTRPGRFIINDALVSEMKMSEDKLRILGMWPVSAFRKNAPGKFEG